MSARNLLWKKYSNPPLDKVPFIYYVITFRRGGVKDKSKIIKKMSKIVPNCPKLSQIVPNCPKSSQIVPNSSQIRPKFVQNLSKICPKFVQNGPKWSKRVKDGQKWSNIVKENVQRYDYVIYE